MTEPSVSTVTWTQLAISVRSVRISSRSLRLGLRVVDEADRLQFVTVGPARGGHDPGESEVHRRQRVYGDRERDPWLVASTMRFIA
jgi:hypothetical protein